LDAQPPAITTATASVATMRRPFKRFTPLSICAVTDEERPIAWLALEKGTPVLDASGNEIGKVSEVVADEQKDIFSGIHWRHGLLGDQHYVPADLIDELTSDAVRLRVSAEEAQGESPG
jgi:hypothetical protein